MSAPFAGLSKRQGFRFRIGNAVTFFDFPQVLGRLGILIFRRNVSSSFFRLARVLLGEIFWVAIEAIVDNRKGGLIP
jgi:hypothetical protein